MILDRLFSKRLEPEEPMRPSHPQGADLFFCQAKPTPCAQLGHLLNHRAYWCADLFTRKPSEEQFILLDLPIPNILDPRF